MENENNTTNTENQSEDATEVNFRFCACKVFLTYPQCSLSIEDLLAEIQKLGQIRHYCISQEQHEDGAKHLHGLIQFASKIDTRNRR